MNTNPPLTGPLELVEAAVAALFASGLKLLPANVNAAGGAGGAIFFSSAAAGFGCAGAEKEKVSPAPVLGEAVFGMSAAVKEGAFPDAKPEKVGEGVDVGSALFSFALSEEDLVVEAAGAGELADGAENENPEKGFGALALEG